MLRIFAFSDVDRFFFLLLLSKWLLLHSGVIHSLLLGEKFLHFSDRSSLSFR